MDLTFALYVFLSIILILGWSYKTYAAGNEVQAGILFVGLISVTVVFGITWFFPTGEVKGGSGGWPPVINYCPDFLTLHTVDGAPVCIDPIGVSKGGKLSKWTEPTQTDEKFLFKLHIDKVGTDRASALCAECEAKGVTWEGVHDGQVCHQVDPPKPPKI